MTTTTPCRKLCGGSLVLSAFAWAVSCSTSPQDAPRQASSAGGDAESSETPQGSGGANSTGSDPAGDVGGNTTGTTANPHTPTGGSQPVESAGQGGRAGTTIGAGSRNERGGSTGAGGSKGQAGSSTTSGKGGAAGSADSRPVDAGTPVQTSGCGATSTEGVGTSTTYNIDVGGTSRKYIVWVPANYDPAHPYRLIFAWHGLGGTAEQIACGYGSGQCRPWFYGLQPLANNTAIFVSGQGLDTGNDAGAGWANSNGRDVAFVRALLEWLELRYCIDATRVFSVGMSYGGVMSNTLGCELGDKFRAIAPASGMGPGGFGRTKPTCAGQVAVWLAHGTQDTTVPIDSGIASRDFWLERNHCSTTTTPAAVSPCVDYQGCDQQYPVTWCAFDGGHTVPSFEAQATWNFLQQF